MVMFRLGNDADDAYAIETYGEVIPSVRREWLLTNGLGGYACGTVADVNTRRYHGTLVAATSPPLGRVVTTNRWGCTLVDEAKEHALWASHMRGNIAGDGPEYLRRFSLKEDVATWEFDADGHKVFKSLFVAWHRNAVALTYRLVPAPGHDGPLSLRLSPFLSLRRHHDLRHSSDASFHVAETADGVWVTTQSASCRIRVADNNAPFEATPDWWYAHTYPLERLRGMDDREDLFLPGSFKFQPDADAGDSVTFWIGVDDLSELDLHREQQRRRAGLHRNPAPTQTQRRLHRAAADFVVKRRRPDGMPGTTILAGYPWPTDWGRDTFIALPGLLLATGRHDVAGQVLSTFAQYASDGMIPNHFVASTHEPLYDTADASLWFINAAFAYLRATKDHDTFDALLRPACEGVVEGYQAGSDIGIKVDPADGLLQAGDETNALTWMDTSDGDIVFTPRHGKAVELNALWYNALVLLGLEEEAARADVFCRGFHTSRPPRLGGCRERHARHL